MVKGSSEDLKLAIKDQRKTELLRQAHIWVHITMAIVYLMGILLVSILFFIGKSDIITIKKMVFLGVIGLCVPASWLIAKNYSGEWTKYSSIFFLGFIVFVFNFLLIANQEIYITFFIMLCTSICYLSSGIILTSAIFAFVSEIALLIIFKDIAPEVNMGIMGLRIVVLLQLTAIGLLLAKLIRESVDTAIKREIEC